MGGGKMADKFEPVPSRDRLFAVDVMRGFALLGIFAVNVMAFQYGVYGEPDYPYGTIDEVAEFVITVSAQGSFYPLFSALFGFGAIMMMERAEVKGINFTRLFTRRLAILLLIGFVHLYFIWEGDILLQYGLTGFVLLLFRNRKPGVLLLWAFALMAVVSFLYYDPSGQSTPYTVIMKADEVYASASYMDDVIYRFTDGPMPLLDGFYTILTFVSGVIVVLPHFLFGAYVAKKKWLHKIQSHAKILKWIMAVTLLIGLPLKMSPYLIADTPLTFVLQYAIGGPLVAAFYITAIALLSARKRWRKLLNPLSYVGRLSLSQYLFQSVVATTIFYGFGFGLYGKLGLFLGLILVLLIYTVQIVLSRQWLKKFRYGPVEWLWRSATYGEVQPFRRYRDT